MNKKTILLTLKNIKGIGNVSAKQIMDSISNKSINLEDLYSILQSFSRIKIKDFNTLIEAYRKAEQLLDLISKSDINFIAYYEPDFPQSFLEINDSPVFLFFAGDIQIASQNCVTVIGSRNASEEGKKVSYNLSKKLCKENIIVSGLAEGIDTEAHKAAVENNGKTIAILAHGLDIIYPAKNKELSRKIVETGGLIMSEYPLGQTYSKFTFVARDRLQSALSNKIFVVEANENSGTMQTAKMAKKYNKEIYVFKSKLPNYEIHKGNLILINQGANTFDENFRESNTHSLNSWM